MIRRAAALALALGLPLGAAAESLAARAAFSSSSFSRWLGVAPPEALICCCCSIAASQAAWPCRSIIAAWHWGDTLVRSEALAAS